MGIIKKLKLGSYYLPDQVLKDFVLCEGYVPFQTGDYRKKAIPAKRVISRQAKIDAQWHQVNSEEPTQIWVADHDYFLLFDVFVFGQEDEIHLGEMVKSTKVTDMTLKRLQYRVWALHRMGFNVGSYTVINKETQEVIETFNYFDLPFLNKYFKTLLDSFKDVISGEREPNINYNLCQHCFRKTHCSLYQEETVELEEDMFLVRS